MRILERLRSFLAERQSAKLQLNDPEFGGITFDSGGWVGELDFRASKLVLYISSNASGPTDAQRKIWRQTKSALDALDQAARDLIRRQCANQLPTSELNLREVWLHSDEHHSKEEVMLVYDNPQDFDGTYRASFLAGRGLYAGRDD
jgi:hypothetical protein